MNLRKLTVIGGAVLGVSFWMFFYQVFASDQASWDGKKVEEENSAFIEEVSVLQGVIARMLQNVGVTKKYCNQKGCWESINDGQSLSFESSERKTMWSSLNYGQSLEWADGEGTHWESLNDGQSTNYDDGAGNSWSTANGNVQRNGNED